MGAASNPLAAGVPALKPPSTTQTMISPDGQYGEIPVERVQDAIKAGFKPGLNMVSPDGSMGTVPVDKAHDAMAAGFKPSGLTLPESKFYAQHPANVLYRNIRQNESPEQIAARQQTAQNASNDIQTVGQGLALAGGAVTAPVATAAGLASGVAGQYGGTKAAKALGADDITANRIGDVTGLVTGAAGGAAGENITPSLNKIVGNSSDFVSGLIDKLSGSEAAIKQAQTNFETASASRAAAKNANFSKYQLAEQQTAEANQAANVKYQGALKEAQDAQESAKQANISKYQQDLQDAQVAQSQAKQANISKYQSLEQQNAESNAAIVAPKQAQLPPEQQGWVDLNSSIRAPASSIKIGLGKGDLASAASMPGRGLAQEGLDASALSKLSPVEQASLIGPKYNASGRAVNETVSAASDRGITFDGTKSAQKVFADIPNPKLKEKAIDAFNETAADLGIANQRQMTPDQAVQLRRALQSNARFAMGGDLNSVKGIGTNLYRSVTSDLHDAVPELVPVDQHYGDMKEAVKAIQKNVQKYGANMPPTAPKVATDLTVAPYKPLPGLPNSASYKPLPSLPEQPTISQLNVSPYKPLPPEPQPVNISEITSQARKTMIIGALKRAAITGAEASVPAYGITKYLLRKKTP